MGFQNPVCGLAIDQTILAQSSSRLNGKVPERLPNDLTDQMTMLDD
jgi:hypothetical protein